MNSVRILLLQMPWASTRRPSIALGILKQLCATAGVPCTVLYPNLDITAAVGFEVAVRFADERALFGLSEHLFAADLFGKEALDSDTFIDTFASIIAKDPIAVEKWKAPLGDSAFLKSLRDEVVPPFLDGLLTRILAEAPTVVGITGTFNQVMGGLAIARRIKSIAPQIQVIAGGACFDADMGKEYHRALPHLLDHVFLGEAEESFVEYLERLKAGRDTRGIRGVTSFVEGSIECLPGTALRDMNSSPAPDYDDFFAEAERARQASGRTFNIEYLPFESTRGCWWGQKNHCVFCGINDDLIAFRAKSVDRVIQEIVGLSARYGVMKLAATDWIISRWHCNELFEKLRRLDLDVEIFYEVRADLSKAQLRAMKEAGIVTVQPGIESFSTPLLKVMRKGASAIRHVQFLRWCREIGISAAYNMLSGFPGEEAQWYLDMARLIPRLCHLQPPQGNLNPIEMHRFAPFYEQRDQFGVDHATLRLDYGSNFPPGLLDCNKIAYFFNFSCSQILAQETYNGPVREALDAWLDAHEERQPPVYEYSIGTGFVRITDTRQGEGRYLRLADLHQDVFLLCDELQTRRKLVESLEPLYPEQVADGTLDAVIAELIESDVLMEEAPFLLSLPIAHKTRSTAELRAYVLGRENASTDRPVRAVGAG